MPPHVACPSDSSWGSLLLPGTAKYILLLEAIKKKLKNIDRAVGVLMWLMICFLKYLYDCIWTDFAQALYAMAACEAILSGFFYSLPAQEAGLFVCSYHVF